MQMHNFSSALFGVSLFVAAFILVFAAKIVFSVPGDRDVAMQAQKMLSQAVVQEDKQIEDQLQQSNQQLTTAIRQRFADVAAFGYSLMSVYTLHSGSLPSRGLLQQNDTAMPNFMAQMSSIVPELFKTYFGPPTGPGDAPSQAEKEDLQCVNACIAGLEQKMVQRMNGPEAILLDNNSGLPGMATAALNTFGRLNCSDEMEGRACVANCSQRHSAAAPFSSFLLSQLDWFLARHCAHPEDQLDVLALLDSCRLAQIPQLAFSFTFEFGNKFAGSFNQANGDQQRCSVVKKTLVDDFSHSISAICEHPTQSQLLDRMLHTTAGYALAQNTEGAIFSRCPDIYSTNR